MCPRSGFWFIRSARAGSPSAARSWESPSPRGSRSRISTTPPSSAAKVERGIRNIRAIGYVALGAAALALVVIAVAVAIRNGS